MDANKCSDGISLLEVAMVIIIVCLLLVFVRGDESKFNHVIMNKNVSGWMIEVASAAERYFSSMDKTPSSMVKINATHLVNSNFLSPMFTLPDFLQVDIYAIPILTNTTTPHFNVLTVFKIKEHKIERDQVSAMLGSEGGRFVAKDKKIYGNGGGWEFDARGIFVKETDIFSFRKVDAVGVSGGGIKNAFLEGKDITVNGSNWRWEPKDNTSEFTVTLNEWSGFYQWNIAITKQFDSEPLFSIDAEGQSEKLIYSNIFNKCPVPDGWYTLNLLPKQPVFNLNEGGLKTLVMNIYIKNEGAVKC